MTIEEAGRVLREQMTPALAEAGRKGATKYLGAPLTIKGTTLTVQTTKGAWLMLTAKAIEAGWRPKHPTDVEVDAADARQFALALLKAQLEPRWTKLVAPFVLIGWTGGFRVEEG